MDHTILYSKLLINFNENEQVINISLLLVISPSGGRVQCKMWFFFSLSLLSNVSLAYHQYKSCSSPLAKYDNDRMSFSSFISRG